MQCYNYSAQTGEYLYSSECQLDPLESKKQGKEVGLLPANATFTPPPTAENGKVAVWNGTAWELKEDNRGTEYWLPGDTWQTEPRAMKDLGQIPEGAVLTRPEPTEKEKFIMLRSARDLRLSATDYLLMPDYLISDDQRAVVQAYRQALRDLPAQPGAPWDGGGDATPWPELPAGLKA